MHRENGKRTRKGFCRAVDLKKERIKKFKIEKWEHNYEY